MGKWSDDITICGIEHRRKILHARLIGLKSPFRAASRLRQNCAVRGLEVVELATVNGARTV